MLKFLPQFFKSGLQYMTTDNYRSVIPAFHKLIQGTPVRKHPRLCTLLAGIFSKLLQPRYCFIFIV